MDHLSHLIVIRLYMVFWELKILVEQTLELLLQLLTGPKTHTETLQSIPTSSGIFQIRT